MDRKAHIRPQLELPFSTCRKSCRQLLNLAGYASRHQLDQMEHYLEACLGVHVDGIELEGGPVGLAQFTEGCSKSGHRTCGDRYAKIQ